MSDQTTLSSFEDSISQMNGSINLANTSNPNITTTTTPPIDEYSNNNSKLNSKSILLNSNNVNVNINLNDSDFVDSLPNVLSSLNLDENSMFSPNSNNLKNPTTPPNDWNNNNNTNNNSNSWVNQNSNNGFLGFPSITRQSLSTSHHHTSSGSNSSLKDENITNSSFDNNNNNNSNNNNNNTSNNQNNPNNSFILPDSYLFDQSITNTPASTILSPNKNLINQTSSASSAALGETSRRLHYGLASPNNNLNNEESAILSNNNNENSTLGMGITPVLNSNDPNQFFGNYIRTTPQQFPFVNHPGSTLINSNSSPLNLLPNLNPATFGNVVNVSNNYPNNLLNQGYGLMINDNNNNNSVPVNNDCTNGDNLNKLNNTKNNNNINNNTNNTNINNTNINLNKQNGLNNHRNNLGLNSTANVHRKHTSNNKRGEDASRFINATLNDFVNEIYYLCKDQHGCRFLQRQLELNGEIAATKIFNEIQLNVIELMIDPFGNYLIQKLLERVDENQRTTLVRNASNQFVRIALDPHGTRALQKLVECISTETEFQIIIQSLSSYVVLLSRDLNGNHVIQKCLQKLPPNYCNFIFDAACDNCVKIAKHRHGCCVLQRCFDHGTPSQCEKLALKVGENAVELSIDPYGNYVVQYVLSMEENRLRIQNDPTSVNKIPDTSKSIDFIINSLGSNLTKLSTHKFGSNVIEKSLRIPTLSPVLINELLKNPESLKLLLHDAYGNYVLQTSLDVANDSSFKDLSELLKPFLSDVRNTPHGRRILSKLISRGGNAAAFGSNSNGLLLNDPVENNSGNNGYEHTHQHNNGRRHNNNNNNNNYHHYHNNNNNNNHRNNNHSYNSSYNNNNNNTAYNSMSNSNANNNNSKQIDQINGFGY